MLRVSALLLLVFCCTINDLHGFTLAKRTIDSDIAQRIQQEGALNFSSVLMPGATEHRKISCFFVFDQDASNDLNNNTVNANLYANKLADLASRYMAHANIAVTNAGTEMWSSGDRISFAPDSDPTASSMPDFLTRFQTYLANTQSSEFGSTYAVGVLLSYKASVAGGYSQGPPCTTSGASLIKYQSIPWLIGGLIAHELAHTLSVVHTFELFYMCQAFPTLSFCATPNPPDECNCATTKYPPEQCLMTFNFGRAVGNAPRYTPCDIEMMNRFSSNIACLIK